MASQKNATVGFLWKPNKDMNTQSLKSRRTHDHCIDKWLTSCWSAMPDDIYICRIYFVLLAGHKLYGSPKLARAVSEYGRFPCEYIRPILQNAPNATISYLYFLYISKRIVLRAYFCNLLIAQICQLESMYIEHLRLLNENHFCFKL